MVGELEANASDSTEVRRALEVIRRNVELEARLIDDLLSVFGGRSRPVVAHLIRAGKLTLDDVKDAERTLRKLQKKEKLQ